MAEVRVSLVRASVCWLGVDRAAPEAAAVVTALTEADVAVEDADDAAGEGDSVVAIVGALDDDGGQRLRALRAIGVAVIAVAVTTRGKPGASAAELLAAGVVDIVDWDADGRAALIARLARRVAVERLVSSPVVRDNLVGTSATWRELLRRVTEVAHFTSASMMLSGDSGTGKELVARLVHALDPRTDKRELVVVDCTTIVPSLSGSEFFGHERGAFTGAAGAREGAFELADRGTLFLDEVGDLPLALQAQLLRVVQERTFKRVGGNDWRRTEFRLVCATHRDLAAAVQRGEFRHDLYHRIATWTFRLPRLDERREDIPVLARHFIRQLRPDGGDVRLDPVVARYLVERDYPGNVRELRQAVQRLVDRYPGAGPITVGQIPEAERASLCTDAHGWPDDGFESAVRGAVARGVGLKTLRRIAEDLAVRLAITLEGGSIARASRRLGVTERALQLRQAARRDLREADEVS